MNFNDYCVDIEALYNAYYFDSEVGEELLQSWMRLRKYSEAEVQLLIDIAEFKLMISVESPVEPRQRQFEVSGVNPDLLNLKSPILTYVKLVTDLRSFINGTLS